MWTKYASLSDYKDEMITATRSADSLMRAFANTTSLPYGEGSAVWNSANANVNVTNNSGLSRYFLDFATDKVGATPVARASVDQTHHFAGYFAAGVRYGQLTANTRSILGTDWPSSNPGDYLLGAVAAQLGDSYSRDPRYMAGEIRQRLGRDPTQDEQAATFWRMSVYNAMIYLQQSGVK
jgi:hypothetical protein